MLLALTLMLGCKGGDDVASDDSAPATDDTAPADDSADIEHIEGESFALVYSGTLSAWFSVDGLVETTQGLSHELVEPDAWTALADFDGDGLDDIWQIPGDRAKVYVYPNSGGAAFAAEASFEPSTGLSSSQPWLVGDFNGDALDDIAQLSSSDRLVVIPNAVGRFDDEARVATDSPFTDTGAMAAGDVDGDGTDDVLYFKDGQLSVYAVLDGALQSAAMVDVEAPELATDALLIDVDSDGLAELALWSGSTLRLYPNTGGAFDLDAGVEVAINRPGLPLGGRLR